MYIYIHIYTYVCIYSSNHVYMYLCFLRKYIYVSVYIGTYNYVT